VSPEKILERRCHRLMAKAKKAYVKADNTYRAAEKVWLDAHRKMTVAEHAWMLARLARLRAQKETK
jgi:hypothetical protein